MNTVFFSDMKAEYGNSLEKKFRTLLKKSAFFETITEGQIVALKVHVGERENLGYINPNYARIVVEEVKARGARPYLTDTNTLYSGGRHNGADHIVTAIQHGFGYATVGAPFIPADGVRGLAYRELELDGKHYRTVKLANGVLEAEKIIFLSHFKGHIEAGFGGSIKNLSMGCASIAGKMEQHAAAKPEVKTDNCVGCRQCYRVCPVGAISMVNHKAVIDYDICIGCGQCVAACNYNAMKAGADTETRDFIEKVTEYAWAASSYFGSNALYINFAMNITPDCDCWPANDIPVVDDVGFFVGRNPFALDRATLDSVNASRPNTTSRYHHKITGQHGLFEEVWDNPNLLTTFDHAASQFGVDLSYTLETVE
jgi:uncharacterized protein